jgi:hypothetical protein
MYFSIDYSATKKVKYVIDYCYLLTEFSKKLAGVWFVQQKFSVLFRVIIIYQKIMEKNQIIENICHKI